MIDEKGIAYLKEKGIPLPPEDSKCQICGKKVKVMIPVNGKWVCKYLICEQKANGTYVEKELNEEEFQAQFK